MRVFLGITEIAGYYQGLCSGLKEHGIEAEQYDLFPRIEYGSFKGNIFVKLSRLLGKKRITSSLAVKKTRIFWGILHEISLFFVLLSVVLRFDVFIFSYGKTFLSSLGYIDIQLLKLLRKKVVFVFHGDDSRPNYLNLAPLNTALPEGKVILVEDYVKKNILLTKQKKDKIDKINSLADYIVDLPNQGILHTKEFYNTFLLGYTVKAEYDYIPTYRKPDSAVRILHAPSHSAFKGTVYIEQAIENLKKKGYNIDFRKVTGVPHATVIEELKECDFVIDQVFSDFLMPGFSIEAGWYGKASVVGTYALPLWSEYLNEDEVPPTVLCHPNDLEQTIEKLILHPEERTRKGQEAREYVERRFHPKQVAANYLQLLRGEAPQHWIINPKELIYIHGVAWPEFYIKDVFRIFYKEAGIESFCIQDKPLMQEKILELIKTVDKNDVLKESIEYYHMDSTGTLHKK